MARRLLIAIFVLSVLTAQLFAGQAEAVNIAQSPSPRIANAVDSNVDELLAIERLNEELRRVPGAVDACLRRHELPSEIREAINRAIRETWNAEDLFAKIRTRLALKTDPDVIANALAFRKSRIALRVRKMQDASANRSEEELHQFRRALESNPAGTQRRGLAARLYSAGEGSLDAQIAALATYYAMRLRDDLAPPSRGINAKSERSREESDQLSQEELESRLTHLLFAARDIPDAELSEYADGVESEPMQAWRRVKYEALQDVLGSAVPRWTARAGNILREKR